MNPTQPQPTNAQLFEKLLEVMATLRGPQGCPWDKKQTHESLKACLLEETYEVLAAIDHQDPTHLKEELGDLLLQIVFHSQIANEASDFEIRHVLETLIQKLTRRHPHVFGDEKIKDPETAIRKWESIKAQERKNKGGLLSGIPPQLPALLRAYRMGSKAARVGFDWPQLKDVFKKVQEELEELQEAQQQQDPQAMEEEFGDLLFSLAQVARFLKVNPEEALRKSSLKFQRRFEWMEQACQKESLSHYEPEALEELWEQAKSYTKTV